MYSSQDQSYGADPFWDGADPFWDGADPFWDGAGAQIFMSDSGLAPSSKI